MKCWRQKVVFWWKCISLYCLHCIMKANGTVMHAIYFSHIFCYKFFLKQNSTLTEWQVCNIFMLTWVMAQARHNKEHATGISHCTNPVQDPFRWHTNYKQDPWNLSVLKTSTLAPVKVFERKETVLSKKNVYNSIVEQWRLWLNTVKPPQQPLGTSLWT